MATSSEIAALEAQRDVFQKGVDTLTELITKLKAGGTTGGTDSGSGSSGGTGSQGNSGDTGGTVKTVSTQVKQTESGGDFVNGTWQGSDRGGLLIDNTAENKAAFVVGSTITLNDKTTAVLDYVQEQAEGITIWSGQTKFASSNGYPNKVSVSASSTGTDTGSGSGSTGGSTGGSSGGSTDTGTGTGTTGSSLPYSDLLIGAVDKTLTLTKASALVADKTVIQLATGQAVNVLAVKDAPTTGQVLVTIDQSISDTSKVIGKTVTVKDRYASNTGSGSTGNTGSGNTGSNSGSTGSGNTDTGSNTGTGTGSTGSGGAVKNSLSNIPAIGINLAAVANANQVLPGEAGTQYKWPSRADVTLYVKTLGLRLLRFPFAYQRAFELDATTGLPAVPAKLTDDFKTKFKQLLGWIKEDSGGAAKIIPDPHTYWRIYRNQTSNGKPTGALYAAGQAGGQGNRWKVQEQGVIDDSFGWGPVAYGDGLALFAKELDDDMIIGWGMGNEPYPDSSIDHVALQAKVIKDLNVILPILRKVTQKTAFICGCYWASARNVQTYSGNYPLGINDPANNWILEGHGYGDVDNSSSGKYNSVPSTVSERQLADVFTPFYAFGAANKLPLFIGETGIPPSDPFRTALKKMLDEAEQAGVPVTLWIAGGDGAMGGEKMNLDDSGHAATRAILKERAGRTIPQWGVAKKIS